jgi:long-chain acyl-CoA synthetase
MSESIYLQRPWLAHYDFWVPPDVNTVRAPLANILSIAATQYPHRPATYFGGAELTFWEIKRQADRLATALRDMGIEPGDRVGIMLPNCPQFPISFFAVLRAGAVIVNINPTYTPPEFDRVASDSGMKALITLDALMPVVKAAPAFAQLKNVIVTSMAEYLPAAAEPPKVEGASAFTKLIHDTQKLNLPSLNPDPDDPAVLQYTGGTTGFSKGAMLTHSSLFTNVIQNYVWSQHLTRRGEEKMLIVLPLFHVYGMVVSTLLGFWNGTQQIYVPKYTIDNFVQTIEDLKPSYVPGVPSLFTALLNHPRAATCGLDLVRGFNSGAAPLPVELIHQFEQLSGAPLREGFGMTETSCTACTTPILARRKPGSVGLPVSSTYFKIVDLDTGEKELALGEEGEICVRGPQVMKGYWNNPAESATALRNGWLYTGDIGRMDEDGYFYIVQRKKDMINVGGLKVFPNEVDDVLYQHPAVLEAAAIGVPDAYRGEVVKAFVVLKPDTQATADELLAFCRERLARFKQPAHIEFIESLPKSAVGKILRRELRERPEKSK